MTGNQGQSPAPTVKDPRRVITGRCRLAYPNLFTAKVNNLQPNSEPMFTATLIFEPGSTDLNPLRQAAYEAAKEKWGAAIPKVFKYRPIRPNSDREGQEGYAPGGFFINCKSKTRPGVIDQAKRKVVSVDVVYPGCWVRCSVRSYAYDQAGNKGVSWGLLNLQKMEDGPRLDGRLPPEQEFDTLPGGADDPFTGGGDDPFGGTDQTQTAATKGKGPLDDDIPF